MSTAAQRAATAAATKTYDGGDCDSNSANDADVGDAAVDDDSDDDGKQQRKQVKILKQYSQWQNDTEGARCGGDDHHCNATG